MNIQAIIANRRDGRPHSFQELEFLSRGAAKGEIADYQLAAWLMAAYLNPLSPQETAWLTLAMAGSGERLDLSELPKPWVDKHSTGGVGDKTTIALLPILAACGLTVVKMSGRGLGITGGTIDKLSSVPGFRLDLTPQEMKDQAGRIGLALTGQTPNLAPADKALYALRDATGTVSSVPLIVSSILSKKIAGGADTLVLDVKCGSGAFMPDLQAATRLARSLAETAALAGLNTHLAITDMDQPLGRTVGNALEVREAIDTLNGRSRGRFAELCVQLAGLTLFAAGLESSLEAGVSRADAALRNGGAGSKAELWFEAQGGDPKLISDPAALPEAPVRFEVRSDQEGFVRRVDARIVGEVVVELGGGRRRKEDQIDPAVGLECLKEVGDEARSGEALFVVHARSHSDAEQAAARLQEAVTFDPAPAARSPLILEHIAPSSQQPI
jgi:pyrimidine-nucleoside phosphorylase